MVDQLLLDAHLLSVAFCAGVVWIVQTLVYPGFADVGPTPGWPEVHARHTATMGMVIGPPWAVQGLTCAWLLLAAPVTWPWALAAGLCGAITVAVTLWVSVPCHRRLARGWDPEVHARLVRTNWWRTAAWTAGAGVAYTL